MPGTPDLIGCHVSTAGGVHKAPARADEMGASTMQIFTANQRTWRAPKLTEAEAAAFKEARAASQLELVMSHDSYLINLASPREDVLEKSLAAFLEEYRRCTLLDIELLNFHPGSHLKSGEESGLVLVAAGMKRALESQHDSKTLLVIEVTAGQGTNLGYKLEHLQYLLDEVGAPERTGICIDTAHVFGAGYDIKDEQGYQDFFTQLDRLIGLDKLRAFHMNDSKAELGSRVDRHEKIGNGKIGAAAFERIMRDPRFFGCPMFLETPDDDAYPEEMRLLRSMRRG